MNEKQIKKDIKKVVVPYLNNFSNKEINKFVELIIKFSKKNKQTKERVIK
jgi:hypothetical protein|tara:strand:+ start:76 stop:225 length:150 start_codon:yes stop_codon:yes gene_type:complete